MPGITHQRNNQKRKSRENAFKYRKQRIQKWRGVIDGHSQGTLAEADHLAGLTPEGLAGKLIMQLLMLCFQSLFNTPYMEQKIEYNKALKEKIDEYSDHDFIYMANTPADAAQWTAMIQEMEGDSEVAYVLTGNNQLFYVDKSRGTHTPIAVTPANIAAIKASLNITDARLQQMVANQRRASVVDEAKNLEEMIRIRTQANAADPQIAVLRGELQTLLNNSNNKNVSVMVAGLNKTQLEALAPHTPGHRPRQFCVAYCRQNALGEFDENGEYPPIYPLDANYEPDFSQAPVNPELVTPTQIRANGFVPVPTYTEGLKAAMDLHKERMMGVSALDAEALLRVYGTHEAKGGPENGDRSVMDDNAARMAMAARPRPAPAGH